VTVGRLDDARLLLDRHDERVSRFGEAQFVPSLALSRALLLATQGDRQGATQQQAKAQELAIRNRAELWMP
jgi:hypothetical protein